MRRNGFTLVEAIVVVAIILILAAILFPVFGRSGHGNDRRFRCQSTLKQIALGLMQYAQDYDDRFPPVAVTRSGYWAGSIQPYLKGWQIFQCPSAKADGVKKTDYFYNASLSATQQKKILYPSQTFLMGDGSDNQPTNYALSSLPAGWRQDTNSPAYRHPDGANYSFADGHVKWLKPEKVTDNAPNGSEYTFKTQ